MNSLHKELVILHPQYGCLPRQHRNLHQILLLVDRDAQTSGVRSPGRLNFIWWRLTMVGHQYGNHSVSPFGA